VGRRRALEARPAGAGVLAFHNGVEEALLLHVEKTSKKGDADDILRTIDGFCYSRHWMMHVGDLKGVVLKNILQQSPVMNPRDQGLCAIELGSYCGYSTTLIAKQLHPGVRLFTVENNLKCRKFTERMLRHAELISNVNITGSIPEAVATITDLGLKIGFIFIDHDKSLYTSDLKLIESSGLMLSPGCVVLADNILSFGVPLNDFINHVSESNNLYSGFELMRGAVEYSVASDVLPPGDAHEDGMCVAIYK
jgi:catechol O-methyltransferase